jgi:predicted RecA/RadA family phage recombinase
MATIEFYHGSANMVDHTPGSNVAAGAIVKLGDITCISHLPIAANTKGSIAFPSGMGCYKVPLKNNAAFSEGDDVYADPTTNEADPNETEFVGYAILACDEATGDTHVYAVHSLMAGAAS